MKLLIFDLDGTLIDSKRDIVLSVNRAFVHLGFPAMAEKQIGDEIGRGSEYLFRRLLGETVPVSAIKELVSCFKEIYRHHLLDHTQIYPRIMDVLFHYRDFPKVIVTNKTQDFADRIVEATGLREWFEAVFGAEAFPTQKPDPGPILAVCEKWNTHPSQAVVIGDSQFDVLAGKAAGAGTVGVLYGFGGDGSFKKYRPDVQVDSAGQLIGLFPIK